MIKNIKFGALRANKELFCLRAFKTRRGVKPSNENRYAHKLHSPLKLSILYSECFFYDKTTIYCTRVITIGF